MISNKFSRVAIITTLAASILAPLAVGAQTSGTTLLRQGKVGAARDAKFCELLGTHQNEIGGRLDASKTKLAEMRKERDSRVETRESEQATKLAALREEQSSKRAEQYAKLDGLATSDAQKAAVSAFKTAAEASITARRSAVDAAMTAFQAGVDKAKADRQTKVDAWISVFEASIKTATDKAKADCAAGGDPAAIRAVLKTATDAARTKLQADRKSIDAIGATVKTLVETRRTAVEKAHADFKVAMEKARADLKAALGPSEQDEEDENTNSSTNTNGS